VDRCALSGFKFSPENKLGTRVNPYALTIDRIDAKSGYVVGNVRLVCLAINIALMDWGEEVFARFAEAYVRRKTAIDNTSERGAMTAPSSTGKETRMSDYKELIKFGRRYALYQEDGDHSDFPEKAAAAIKTLLRERDEARAKALEEAAGVAEEFEIDWSKGADENRNMIVLAILALKDKP
jgi:hypothetical protein